MGGHGTLHPLATTGLLAVADPPIEQSNAKIDLRFHIAGLGILRKEGYNVKAGTFMKLSVPFTLAAVITGYVLIWVIWKP